MKASEKIDAIAAALSKAQAEMGRAKKDSSNPHFKSKYADLASCWDACQGPLTTNGIAVLQANKPNDKGVTIETRLIHTSGQWLEDDGLYVPASKVDAQGFGSALTYCRRYALCAMVGIAPEDDDGNAAAASQRSQAAKPAEKPKAKAEPAKVDFDKFTTALLAASTCDAVKKLIGSIDKKDASLADKDVMYAEAFARYLSLDGPEVQWAAMKIDTLVPGGLITPATHERLVKLLDGLAVVV